MLKQRVITALVLLFVILLALFADTPLYWALFISLVVTIGFWEWLRLCQINDPLTQGLMITSFVVVLFLAQSSSGSIAPLLVLVCALWLVLMVFTISSKLDFLHRRLAKLLIGYLILIAAGLAVIRIQQLENGALWILCMFVCVWAADIGAYFVGRRFGKTKLAPTVSPGKTIEGLLGGIAFALILYVPIMYSVFPFAEATGLLAIVTVTVLVSVMGDLFESKLKRHAGIKDSSQILPGHGGVLDRIDSLMVGAPVFSLGLVLLGRLS